MGWVRRQADEPKPHRCELPLVDGGVGPPRCTYARIGDVWRCDDCGELWVSEKLPTGLVGNQWQRAGWRLRRRYRERKPKVEHRGGYPAGSVSRLVMPKVPKGPAPGAIPASEQRGDRWRPGSMPEMFPAPPSPDERVRHVVVEHRGGYPAERRDSLDVPVVPDEPVWDPSPVRFVDEAERGGRHDQ